ncbi:hypothetical protein M5K25_013623 [Dendrobium thyrsiflorum]|uniref:Uncharacterized protein n=1 Tax=Dendrobium thyrsiflorum TaxID=117978 RepID=A0ABD0V0T0_DENTH
MLKDAPAHENELNWMSNFPNQVLNLLDMLGSEQEPDTTQYSALGVPSHDRLAQVRLQNSTISCGNVMAVCDMNAGMEVVLGMDIHGMHYPSYRYGNSPIVANLHHKAIGSCTQAVCFNTSTQVNADFEQKKVPYAQPSKAFPMQNSPARSSAWKRIDFIHISPQNKAEVLADDGVTINFNMVVVNDNKMKLERALVGRKCDSPPQIIFSAKKTQQFEDTSTKVLNLSKQQFRVSMAHFEELLQFGPIAIVPRKRKKTLQDDMGGDFVPFGE